MARALTSLGTSLALSVLFIGCTAITNSDIEGQGLGTSCTTNEECHAGLCDRGICVSTCNVDDDCPAPTKCVSRPAEGGRCHKPLKVAALWVGVISGGEGWTLTHQEGMKDAKVRAPYLDWYAEEQVVTPDQIAAAVDRAVTKEKAEVIILNSFSQRDKMLELAPSYPNVTFLNALGYRSNGKNASAFGAHEEQAWWVAGRVAATKAKTRLGYIGSLITPEVVRHITAFYLGAKSIRPQIQLEVQWLGFWFDHNSRATFTYNGPLKTNPTGDAVYREELLTHRLIESGAEVIAHGADSQKTVRLIERLTKDGTINRVYPGRRIYSISNDNRNGYREINADGSTAGAPFRTCLGSPFWNWGPLYASMFDQIHKGAWKAENRDEVMSTNVDTSVPGFNLNPLDELAPDDIAVRTDIKLISEFGWEHVFNGPYVTTGQRDSNGDGKVDGADNQAFADGEKMSPAEYASMCWFPKGIIEKTDPRDPTSADRDARVPDAARIASDGIFVDDVLSFPGARRGEGIDCKLNQ